MNIEQVTDPSVLTAIFQEEFDSYPPSLEQGAIFAIKNGEEIEAFITAEHLLRVGMVWVHPKHRKTPKAVTWLKGFIRFLLNIIPYQTSVIAIDDTGQFSKTFKTLGLRHVKGDLWRIDI